MAITKTKFINYIRCPRYCALDEIKKNELMADVSLDAYLKEEQANELQSIIDSMYNEEGESLIDVEDPQLKTMLPYYKEIEMIAAKQVAKKLGGKPLSSLNNKYQESFDFDEDGIKYLCYVDIYNEKDNSFDIIEVKATTSRKFLELGPSHKDDSGTKETISIFTKKEDGIYYLKDEIDNYKIEDEMTIDKYNINKQKLSDKYHECGHYVYDLLVQRMIIENDLKQHHGEDKINNIKYYLAVLNSEYIFDGKYDEHNNPIYDKDDNGNDMIVLFDFTKLTSDLIDKVNLDRKKVLEYIKEMKAEQCAVGIYCEHKKTTKCKFLEPCFYHVVPKKNSILNYDDNHYGFKDESGTKYTSFELINDGKSKILDIPESWLTRNNNIIQRRVVESNNPYINQKKILDGLKQLEYPLYHLDFETFPCPLPRYKGEKCYTQSVFQFSLHKEIEPGICDKEKDHYEFLAYDHSDLREELVKKLCEYIDPSKGMIIVYNATFERGRLTELANLFPEYRSKLLKIREIVFDLMNIIQNSSKLYRELGYSEEEAKTFNYYHKDLNGSFSIKKVLPIFAPELNYNSLEVGNGVEALVTYATFPTLTREEFKTKYKALLEYCKQDTWAMVVILDNLRKIILTSKVNI